MTRFLFLLLLALCASSCSLDSFLFNEERIDRYELPTAVIPEHRRTMVTFPSEGHTLYGFWVLPPDSCDTGCAVLYCHGNKRHIGEYWDRVELLYTVGLRVFIFDYRGFGLSDGTPSLPGLCADGRAALRFMLDSLRVDSTRLAFYGYSLGNVVSLDLAAHTFDPLRLYAEAPLASGEALFRASTPLDLPGNFVIGEDVDNVAAIRGIHAPLLLLHGARDDFVPWDANGRVLFESAPEPKSLELVAAANHTDIPLIMSYERYRQRILDFLNTEF